jgi:predicted DsbA family dithiol-disulfide isomerase
MAAVTAAVAVTAASAGASYAQSRKAAKASKKANAAQRKINRLKNKQSKRQFLRNFRQAQASTLMESVAAGVGLESSRFQGTLSSQQAQAEQAVREMNQMDTLGGEVTRFENKATSAGVRAGGFGAVSNIAASFISFGP